MLSFLLDEHVPLDVTRQLRSKRPEIPVIPLQEWEHGVHRGVDEALWLDLAREQCLTLITFDRRTIEPLLRSLGDRQISHGGVVFADDRTLAQGDIGALIRALIELWDSAGDEVWTDRVSYLKNPGR